MCYRSVRVQLGSVSGGKQSETLSSTKKTIHVVVEIMMETTRSSCIGGGGGGGSGAARSSCSGGGGGGGGDGGGRDRAVAHPNVDVHGDEISCQRWHQWKVTRELCARGRHDGRSSLLVDVNVLRREVVGGASSFNLIKKRFERHLDVRALPVRSSSVRARLNADGGAPCDLLKVVIGRPSLQSFVPTFRWFASLLFGSVDVGLDDNRTTWFDIRFVELFGIWSGNQAFHRCVWCWQSVSSVVVHEAWPLGCKLHYALMKS